MKITRKELRRLIEATITFSDEEKENIKKAKSNAIKSTADGIARNSGLSTDAVADAAEKVDDNEADLSEDAALEEKKKRKKKKRKNKKRKNKSSRKSKMRLYPYFFGNLGNSNNTYYEPGIESGFDGAIGGDGGGGE